MDSIARIVAYSESHSELVLRVEGPSNVVRTSLVLSACRRIEAPTRWRGVALRFESVANEDFLYALVDDAVRFRVVCGLVLVGDPRDVE